MWGVPVADAVNAAVSVAAAFGMPVSDPVVLADGSNVLLHLRPAPVVARVASLTAEVRPNVAEWLARDLAVSAYLGERGLQVVPPAAELPSGPHHHNGIALAYFGYVPHDVDHRPSPAEFAGAVADLHDALAGYPGELPEEGPVRDVRRALVRLEGMSRDGNWRRRPGPVMGPGRRILDRDVLAVIGAEFERLAERMRALPVRPLHGDAHPGNLLASPDGLVWNDFEDTWRGPLAWDLACVANTSLLDGRAALRAYPADCPAEDVELCREFRRLYGVGWRFILAERFPEQADEARRNLEQWLAR
jgi:hypothetical protein